MAEANGDMSLNPFVMVGGAAALATSTAAVIVSEASALIFGIDLDANTLIPIGSVTGLTAAVAIAFLKRTKEQDSRTEVTADRVVAWANQQRDDAIAERDLERRARVRQEEACKAAEAEMLRKHTEEIRVKDSMIKERDQRILTLTNLLLEIRATGKIEEGPLANDDKE